MATSGVAKTFIQSLKRFFKKPWEITGPCSGPEYRDAIPMALEYRRFCPATAPVKAIIPTSDPETVYDIKYYTRDRRRDRPPVRRTVLRKADVEKMMAEKTFDIGDFPRVYLTAKVEEDDNARGGDLAMALLSQIDVHWSLDYFEEVQCFSCTLVFLI
ncbi:hypothetical protein DsansV1_C03g0024881 [Dioscorea sansibarensis]